MQDLPELPQSSSIMLSLLSDCSARLFMNIFGSTEKKGNFFGRVLVRICHVLYSFLLFVSAKEKLPQWRMLVVLGSALVPKKMKEADRKTIRCIRFIVIQRFKIIIMH